MMSAMHLLDSINLLAALFYQQQMITGYNVALNKKAIDCHDNEVSKILFDGDTNYNRSLTIGDMCFGSNTYIEIDLGGAYDVHYVVVYAGIETKTGQLDYFQVQMGNEEFLLLCSEFWGPADVSADGMRVNCETSYSMSSKVRVQSQMNKGLSISEIEVHTLGNSFRTTPGEKPKFYRGCLTKFGESMRTIRGPLFAGCQKDCSNSGYLFFGIKNNTLCQCMKDYDENDEVPIDSCNLLCEDGINLCGGIGAFSVYLVSVQLPTYKGCLVVSESSLKSRIQDVMNISMCLNHCVSYNFAFLKDGNICFCLNDTIPSADNKRFSCTEKCRGNSNQFCGGKDYLSVYETCLKRIYESITCSKLLKCADSYDMYGLCLGGCKEGYHGDYCLERIKRFSTKYITKTTAEVGLKETSLLKFPNTSSASQTTTKFTTNSEVPRDECPEPNPCAGAAYTECAVHGRIKCVCIVGYTRDDEFSRCEDVDECVFEPCDPRNAVCHNTNGSYICECLPEFNKRMSSDICLQNSSEFGLVASHSRYWLILASISPLLSIMILFTFFCFSSSKAKTDSDT